ncbi:MAG: two component transcriptional regulator, winged helix family [Clostridiales bacterium]|jgi:DNA-binding response OmpR family regulator|nr:two component transcriptional regulator, winged helix family [Clostridiales bacterium]
MHKILLVEDDANINNMIFETLIKNDLSCTQAFSGSEAKLCVKNEHYDLILLDLMLPGICGDVFLKELRTYSKVPVIVVSAKDELDSKVDLLTTGADDYITKPFELKELVARVNVQLRRENNQTISILSCKDLKLSKNTFEVMLNDIEINMTKQEFKILELLLTYPNRVFSKQDIYDYAWDEYFIGEDKTINVHISNIRNKIKKITEDEYIETVWGVGFKLKL